MGKILDSDYLRSLGNPENSRGLSELISYLEKEEDPENVEALDERLSLLLFGIGDGGRRRVTTHMIIDAPHPTMDHPLTQEERFKLSDAIRRRPDFYTFKIARYRSVAALMTEQIGRRQAFENILDKMRDHFGKRGVPTVAERAAEGVQRVEEDSAHEEEAHVMADSIPQSIKEDWVDMPETVGTPEAHPPEHTPEPSEGGAEKKVGMIRSIIRKIQAFFKSIRQKIMRRTKEEPLPRMAQHALPAAPSARFVDKEDRSQMARHGNKPASQDKRVQPLPTHASEKTGGPSP